MLKKIFLFLMIAVVAGFATYTFWRWQSAPVSMSQDSVEVLVPRGSSVKEVADVLEDAGIRINPLVFTLYARYTGQASQLKAGTYEIKKGQTGRDILSMIANGEVVRRSILFVEGWTYKQIRQAVANHPDIKQTLLDTEEKALMQQLGVPSEYPSMEGLLFPDTYIFTPGDSDIEILRQAYASAKKHLMLHWNSRAEDLPLKSPYEALILASIVEKETGHGADRGRVAGVFINRLKIKMPLQTDPTVIYGMGDKYQGKIRKVDLQTDTLWNTYTRNGLPPTPIASPGELALQATLHPEKHNFLYFVARGDGTSVFAENLLQHNRNVKRYILQKGKP